MNEKILFVGCGKMGGALLGGIISKGGSPERIAVMDPNPAHGEKYGVRTITDGKIPSDFNADIVIFAVKPQIIESVLPGFAKSFSDDVLFISVAAGKTVAFYKKHLGEAKKIVRAMPNLPALVGRGVTVFYGDVPGDYKEKTTSVFSSVGEVFWLDDEGMIDAVTAVSGSGPAYVFHFMECLINAGVKLGLPDDLAKTLAYSTVSGSAQLALESENSVTELKEQVVSPGGTTQAGLNVLSADGVLNNLIEGTTKAACARSKELAE